MPRPTARPREERKNSQWFPQDSLSSPPILIRIFVIILDHFDGSSCGDVSDNIGGDFEDVNGETDYVKVIKTTPMAEKRIKNIREALAKKTVKKQTLSALGPGGPP